MFHCTHPRPSSDYKSQKEFSFSLLLITPPPLQISDQILQAANKSTFVGSVLVSQGLACPQDKDNELSINEVSKRKTHCYSHLGPPCKM